MVIREIKQSQKWIHPATVFSLMWSWLGRQPQTLRVMPAFESFTLAPG